MADKVEPRKAKRIACITCRQAKLKCEGLGRGTKCHRCAARSLECRVDTEYKRVHKRSKLEDLSEELKALRAMLNPPSAIVAHPASRVEGASHTTPERQTIAFSGSTPGSSSHLIQAATSQQDSATVETTATTDRTLGDVRLNAQHVHSLFRRFYSHFHPYLPIFNEGLTPDETYNRSPLLYWTIVFITARGHREEPGLSSNLLVPLNNLLWSKISEVPCSHWTIQAILLLCLWPFNTLSMINDSTLMLISTARTSCMHIGLHRPEVMQDYNRVRFRMHPEQVAESVKLWVACFIVAESITSTEGHETMFAQVGPTINMASRAGNPYKIPNSLRQILVIQMFLRRLNLSLLNASHTEDAQEPDSDLGALLLSFEDELGRLINDLEDVEDIAAYWACCVKLHVQSYYFLARTESQARKPGLLRAYHTAIDLIDRTESAGKDADFNSTAPRYFGQMLKQAALVITKLLHSSYVRFLNFEEGKRVFIRTLDLHKSMSVEANDFHARAAMFLSYLWAMLENIREASSEEPILQLRTRYSASLLHEGLWMWRDHAREKFADAEQLGRPPRRLPSIVQHSPAASKESTSPMNTVDNQAQAEAPITVDINQYNLGWSNMMLPNADLNHADFSVMQSDFMDPFSPSAIGTLNTYLAPDLEASGLFYP